MNDKIVIDTYEAAFYMTYGARIVAVRSRRVPENKVKKLHMVHRWEVLMDGIPDAALTLWKNNLEPARIIKQIKTNRKHIKDRVDKEVYGRR